MRLWPVSCLLRRRHHVVIDEMQTAEPFRHRGPGPCPARSGSGLEVGTGTDRIKLIASVPGMRAPVQFLVQFLRCRTITT